MRTAPQVRELRDERAIYKSRRHRGRPSLKSSKRRSQRLHFGEQLAGCVDCRTGRRLRGRVVMMFLVVVIIRIAKASLTEPAQSLEDQVADLLRIVDGVEVRTMHGVFAVALAFAIAGTTARGLHAHIAEA
jgi:hypothetical protein